MSVDTIALILMQKVITVSLFLCFSPSFLSIMSTLSFFFSFFFFPTPVFFPLSLSLSSLFLAFLIPKITPHLLSTASPIPLQAAASSFRRSLTWVLRISNWVLIPHSSLLRLSCSSLRFVGLQPLFLFCFFLHFSQFSFLFQDLLQMLCIRGFQDKTRLLSGNFIFPLY